MKLVAVNGSPRKQWNTARLLDKVVEGAQDAGMDARRVDLYGLDYKGCTSCFGCKRLGGKSYGRCAMRDGLTPLLDAVHEADALVLGTPLYLMAETGEMRSLLERLAFQYLRYDNPPGTLFPRRIRVAFVYTMNIDEEQAEAMGLPARLEPTRAFLELVFGACEIQCAYDTLQFSDYSLYENRRFDPEAKRRRHETVFPQDRAKAFALGRRMAEPPPAK